MNRRGFLAGILAACAAPAIAKAGVLMPVRKIWTPPTEIVFPIAPQNGDWVLAFEGVDGDLRPLPIEMELCDRGLRNTNTMVWSPLTPVTVRQAQIRDSKGRVVANVPLMVRQHAMPGDQLMFHPGDVKITLE
jgi:hypothetical protein